MGYAFGDILYLVDQYKRDGLFAPECIHAEIGFDEFALDVQAVICPAITCVQAGVEVGYWPYSARLSRCANPTSRYRR
jgi:hypothetical protein